LIGELLQQLGGRAIALLELFDALTKHIACRLGRRREARGPTNCASR
jgi:hypothetical protein